MVQEVVFLLPRPAPGLDIYLAAIDGPPVQLRLDGVDMLAHHRRDIAVGAVAQRGRIIPGPRRIGPLLGIGAATAGGAELGYRGWPGVVSANMRQAVGDFLAGESFQALHPFRHHHGGLDAGLAIRPRLGPDRREAGEQGRCPFRQKRAVRRR